VSEKKFSDTAACRVTGLIHNLITRHIAQRHLHAMAAGAVIGMLLVMVFA